MTLDASARKVLSEVMEPDSRHVPLAGGSARTREKKKRNGKESQQILTRRLGRPRIGRLVVKKQTGVRTGNGKRQEESG